MLFIDFKITFKNSTFKFTGQLGIMQQIREKYDNGFNRKWVSQFPPGEYTVSPKDNLSGNLLFHKTPLKNTPQAHGPQLKITHHKLLQNEKENEKMKNKK